MEYKQNDSVAALPPLPQIQVPEQSYQQIVLNAEPLRNKDFTLNMPENVTMKNEEIRGASSSIYGKMFGGVEYLASNVWAGIEYLSVGVSDFFGITAPRYELWMEDSIKYQEELKRNDPVLNNQNSMILKEMQTEVKM